MYHSIVILASSRKHGGFCLAGKLACASDNKWVRPVSVRPGQAWTARSLALCVGGVPRIGDVVALPLAASAPEEFQRENCSVGFARWRVEGRVGTEDILQLVDNQSSLWLNGWHTVHGWNDRIPYADAVRDCQSSLMLIRPESLQFRLDQSYGKLSLRAEFNYRGEDYDLSVTDETARSRWIELLAKGHSGHVDALLSISLAQPFNGFCYKIVAGVIELPSEGST